MNENCLIEVIKNITKSRYIGDDCAYLPDLGITVTQDSLVEGVHFNLDWTIPYELGVKAIRVNISDIFASGAEPAYALVSLSMPSKFNDNFVEEFYKGLNDGGSNLGGLPSVEIVGGDLTGGDRVFISICMLGKVNGRNISSRSNAKSGYKMVVCGKHGSSAAGLKLLEKGQKAPEKLIQAHISPHLFPEFALSVSKNITEPYAMMDTSDGLGDALFKIARASNVTLNIDFDKIPYDEEIKCFKDWEQLVLFGGEDYGLVAALPESYIPDDAVIIGEVSPEESVPLIIKKSDKIVKYSSVEEFTFNHFS